MIALSFPLPLPLCRFSSPTRRMIATFRSSLFRVASFEKMAASEASVGLDEYSCWMEKLPCEKHSSSLRDITIPGSHDSGAFRLDVNLEVGVDEAAPRLGVDFEQPNMKSMLYNWSKTQSLNIYEQLAAGIRYLDLRTALRDEDNKFYLLHRLYGAGVVEALEDVKKFVFKNPKEIIILHFQHFYNMDTKAHEELVDILLSMFRGVLHSPGIKAMNATLREIWQSGNNIIVLYRDDEVASRYPFLWPHHFIKNPWGNTDNKNALLQFLDKECNQSTYPQDSFHVTQAVLSPQPPTTIVKDLGGSLKDNLALMCNDEVCSWLKRLCASSEKLHKFNIIMADFVEHGQFVQTVVNMNYIY